MLSHFSNRTGMWGVRLGDGGGQIGVMLSFAALRPRAQHRHTPVPRIRYQMKIDHDIPLQPSHRGRPCGSKTRYPFNQMEVGDSFIVAADRVHSVRVIIGRRKDARRYIVGHDGNAYRCWRTA